MRNQSEEIYEYIKSNPGASIEDIVEGTGWNRHLVEITTALMCKGDLIAETGRTDWDDPKFEVSAAGGWALWREMQNET